MRYKRCSNSTGSTPANGGISYFEKETSGIGVNSGIFTSVNPPNISLSSTTYPVGDGGPDMEYPQKISWKSIESICDIQNGWGRETY